MDEAELCETCGEELPYNYNRKFDYDLKKPICVLLFCDKVCVRRYIINENKKERQEEELAWKSEG